MQWMTKKKLCVLCSFSALLQKYGAHSFVILEHPLHCNLKFMKSAMPSAKGKSDQQQDHIHEAVVPSFSMHHLRSPNAQLPVNELHFLVQPWRPLRTVTQSNLQLTSCISPSWRKETFSALTKVLAGWVAAMPISAWLQAQQHSFAPGGGELSAAQPISPRSGATFEVPQSFHCHLSLGTPSCLNSLLVTGWWHKVWFCCLNPFG